MERQEVLCEIASHNFPLLGLNHIRIENKDGIRHLQEMSSVDWIFIDPARRDGHGGKTVAIADCEPNVAELESLLLEKAQHVMSEALPYARPVFGYSGFKVRTGSTYYFCKQ